MAEFVYLVMDADRDVLDVCETEASAESLAHKQGATFERWPISREPRDAAWHRALMFAKGMRP